MKILYILDRPNLYGSEQHLLRLLDLLAETYNLSVLSFSDGPLLELIRAKNVPVSLIAHSWLSLFKLKALRDFISIGAFDLVHAHQPKALLWGSISAKMNHVPCIITVHSLPSSNVQTYSNPLKKIVVGAFHYAVKTISEFLATKVVYLSEFSFKQALNSRKSIVIPNWIEHGVEDKSIKPNFNKELQFISVGSVTYNKGMDRMISALGLIKDHQWTIKIVGNYEEQYQLSLLKRATQLGIVDRISFLGFVNNVEELLLKSDGFILLSRGETFGLVYVEAMNCGLPIVAWDIPVIKEIVPAGNLILQRPEDIKQIFQKFYRSTSHYRALSSANRLFVEQHFTAAGVESKYRNLYDQVLSDNKH